MEASNLDKQQAAVCGLFCGSCALYIGTTEDPNRLKALSERMQIPVDDLKCEGCRSETVSFYCKTCAFKQCVSKKGIDFCGQCSEYPCETLTTFQAERPHRIELWQSLDRINEVGWEQWLAEQRRHYSCPECGTINSAYDLACRQCGTRPGCEYVRQHGEEVARFFGAKE